MIKVCYFVRSPVLHPLGEFLDSLKDVCYGKFIRYSHEECMLTEYDRMRTLGSSFWHGSYLIYIRVQPPISFSGCVQPCFRMVLCR